MPFPQSPHKQPFNSGEVALIGCGPGDPDLLTVQAYRFIVQAEVAIYDRLVSEEIMALLPENCERIYVGKKQAVHKVPQSGINQLMVDHAKRDKRVARLKGGDPFVFGRGGEEAQYLLENNVACHIIPGMTAASACSGYAAIPLTHREVSRSCSFITGHVSNNGELALPWETLTNNEQTIVFYMGVKSLPIITEQLINAGRLASTPAALIERGTTSKQRIFRGRLDSLTNLVAQHKIKPPSLIIIGNVVNTFEETQLHNLGYLAPQNIYSLRTETSV